MDEREEIKQKIPVVDLIAETVQLKKAGRNFRGLCPFHNEKSPSFTVSPERQIWHCFGCGKGGDVFTFLMELDHIEFPEALKLLAARAGVTLKNRVGGTKQQELREQLLAIHHLSQELYHYLLLKHSVGEHARAYLKERGMNEKLIETFGLGYAPSSWDTLYKFLTKKGYSDELLSQSGLVIKGSRGYYDRFRGRIMFPLKNYRGETIAFAGRVLPASKELSADEVAKLGAKYVNSPETPIYIKGDNLYGLEVSKESIRKLGYVVIVEGEFDMISSFAAGVSAVVAIKGTALTDNQIRLLKRFSEKMILSLDADSAGDAAARRGIEAADKLGMEIRVVMGLQGKDPDDMARAEPAKWKELVEKSVAYYDFIIDSAMKRHDPHDPYGKKKITDEVLPILARIQNSILQSHYLKILSTKLGVSEEKLGHALNKRIIPPQNAAPAPVESEKSSLQEKFEEYLLALLVQSDHFSETAQQIMGKIDPSDIAQPAVSQILMHVVDLLAEHPTGTLSDLTKTLPSELQPMLDKASLRDISLLSSADMFASELTKAITLVKKGILRRKILEISTKLHIAEEKGIETDTETLSAQLLALTAALKSLPDNS